MRGLDVVPVSSPVSNSTLDEYEGVFEPRKIYGWLFECHGFWHNLALIVFSSMFVLYLASHAKEELCKAFTRQILHNDLVLRRSLAR